MTSSAASSDSRPLTNEQTTQACVELIDTKGLSYPKIERYYRDPLYSSQVYCLHSFVPSLGAQPDEHGIYGFMKCRGTFFTLEEANHRAGYIIRNMDSYHKILTNHCGQPFPLCSNSEKYAHELENIDLKEEITKTMSEEVKKQRQKEKQEIKEIKEREKKILERNKKIEKEDIEDEDPLDTYITKRVKMANQIWTYHNTMKKIEELKNNIKKVNQEIKNIDNTNPNFKQEYYNRYMEARRDSGLDNSVNVNSEDNFIKYMCEDINLDFLEDEKSE
jgi:hypothetical protein